MNMFRITAVTWIISSLANANNPLELLNFSNREKKSSESQETKTLINADDVSYEEDLGLVVARGNVIISDGKELLEADTATYNKKLNILSASGNVRLYKESGELITGNHVELSEDMKKGFIHQIYLVTPHEERFAANKGYKNDTNVTLEEAVYSPCKLCKKDKKSPTWQLRASTIKRDQETLDVSYRNLVLDFKGVPSFYIPYFSHPDPSVERRSGFLMPSFGNGRTLGTTVTTPFYWSISPQHDITLLPTYMSQQGELVEAAYRGIFSNGTLTLDSSTTNAKGVSTSSTAPFNPSKRQAHFFANTRFDLTDTWRFKAEGTYVSDPTYFRRYYFVQNSKFFANGTLNNEAVLEGFYDRNYLNVGMYDFQNLRADINSHTIPSIVPASEGEYNSDTDDLGGNWKFGANQNYITRRLGTKMGRISSWGSYNLPYISSLGTFHTVQAEVRGDLYKINNYTILGSNQPVKEIQGRIIPTLSISNGLPLITYVKNHSIILEPVVKAIISSNGTNTNKIPDEDSQDFEFDTTNVMRTNRLPGFDIVDSGQRVSYGLNFNFFEKGTKQLVKGFMGQSYSFSKENQFSPYSGIYKGASDYVGSLMLTPHSYFQFNIMTRLDRNSLKTNKNLIQTQIGPPLLNLNIDYVSLNRQFVNNQYVPRKQLTATIHSQFHENWGAYLKATKELGNYNPGDLEHGVGLRYGDDCFSVNLDGFRTFYQDRDLRPSRTVMLTFSFKNLGTYSTGRLDLNKIGEAMPENPNATPTPTT